MSQAENGQRARVRLQFRGLTAQIALWTVLPLTLVLIGVAFTGVYSHEQAMRKLVQERDQALALVAAAQVRDLLQTRSMLLAGLAAEQAFRLRDYAAQVLRLAEAGDLDGLLSGAVALVDETGSRAVADTVPLPWTQEAPLPDLARMVMAQQEPVFTAPYDAPWGEGAMLLGVPVYDEAGTTYGVLAGPVSLQSLKLEGLLKQLQVGRQGMVYLVDGTGDVLVRSPAEHARLDLTGHTGLSIALQDDNAGATLCQAPDGERMTLAYAPINYGGLRWHLLIEEPWDEVIGPVLRYSQFMPLVAVLAAIVSVLALYYGVQSIARPLQALGQQAERVAWGDFEATGNSVGGVQEIEDLRRTLDQMARRIQSYQRGMHNYIAAITEGQEEERKRLARELHDETAQALVALNQQIEMTQKLLLKHPDQAAERMVQIRAMLAEAIEGVRRFSRDLRPIYLEDLGFIPALEMLTREADEREALTVHFAAIGQVRRLTPDVELAAYRMVQEALNNVIQHAHATQAWVEVRFEPQHLVLSVRDDGQGFQPPDLPDALARQGHFGLMGIQERALLYSGRLTIHSAPGKGTEVSVDIALPAQD